MLCTGRYTEKHTGNTQGTHIYLGRFVRGGTHRNTQGTPREHTYTLGALFSGALPRALDTDVRALNTDAVLAHVPPPIVRTNLRPPATR